MKDSRSPAVTDTLIDFASTADLNRVRRALAEADFHRLLKPLEIAAALSRGRPGSATLRRAMKRHLPRLALTRSGKEAAFVFICEDAGIPLPQINAVVEGIRVDAWWPERRLVVEIDGPGNHGTPAQIARDRRNELTLRRAGILVFRYASDQLRDQIELLIDDVRAAYDRPDIRPQ